MRVTSARFLAAATAPTQLPTHRWPEVAFAGRSNVGKSSLLNCLIGRRGLARVSKTPGRTQQLNFFVINEAFVFVDLPGYGFARVPIEVKQQWRHLVEAYLTERQALRKVVVILDVRRDVEEDDQMLFDFLSAQDIPTLPVATKSDKLKRHELAKRVDDLRRSVHLDLQVVSARTGDGIGTLWKAIDRSVREPPAPPRLRSP